MWAYTGTSLVDWRQKRSLFHIFSDVWEMSFMIVKGHKRSDTFYKIRFMPAPTTPINLTSIGGEQAENIVEWQAEVTQQGQAQFLDQETPEMLYVEPDFSYEQELHEANVIV